MKNAISITISLAGLCLLAASQAGAVEISTDRDFSANNGIRSDGGASTQAKSRSSVSAGTEARTLNRSFKTGTKLEGAAPGAGSDIGTDIRSAFGADSKLNSLPIRVLTRGNAVKLEGRVRTETERAEAERAVRGIRGVSDVTNNIEVSAD